MDHLHLAHPFYENSFRAGNVHLFLTWNLVIFLRNNGADQVLTAALVTSYYFWASYYEDFFFGILLFQLKSRLISTWFWTLSLCIIECNQFYTCQFCPVLIIFWQICFAEWLSQCFFRMVHVTAHETKKRALEKTKRGFSKIVTDQYSSVSIDKW